MAMSKSSAARKTRKETTPPRLHTEVAARILRLQKERGAGAGARLVELELCRQLGVSRTPIRGALNILASQGLVEARANRGFVLRGPVEDVPEVETVDERAEEDHRLFVAISEARLSRRLPDRATQQELVRMFNTNVAAVVRVLRQMADLGVAERNRGNGWRFLPTINTERAQQDSYELRMVLEPALLLQPRFRLDTEWSARTRKLHQEFRKRRWRPTLAVALYEMNADFHETLARCSGNQYMLSIMQQQNRLRSFINYRWDYGAERVQAAIDEHLDILTALDKGNNDVAAVLMRRHLDIASKTLRTGNACCAPDEVT